MTDPNLGEFYTRIARIEKARAKGYGFEADGTLGRSYYSRHGRRRIPVLGPLLMIGLCFAGMKGVMHYKIGDTLYDQRVELLLQGEGLERLGGYLMQADPVTLFISRQLQQLDI